LGNIRVHQLATELRKSNREVSDRLRKLGIEAKTNLSSVTPEDSNRVRVSFGMEPLKIVKPKPKKKLAKKKPAAKKEKKPAGKKPAAKKEKKPARKKPAGKKPAAKKPAAKKEKKPAGKKPAGKKPAKKKPAAKKATKPARKKEPAKKAVAGPLPAPAEESGEKAPVKKVPAKARIETGKPERAASAVETKKAPVRPKVKEARVPEKTEQKKLRVAPPDKKARAARPSGRRKGVYRFVPRGRRAPSRAKGPPSTKARKHLRVPCGVTVKEFAQMAGLTPSDVLKRLVDFGETLTVNQSIPNDALKLLSESIGVEIKIKAPRLAEFEEIVDDPEDLVDKPPVVTVMGHVDHGKTLLLDAIRKSDVVGSEVGGITQHIGAYQIEFNGKIITFIDTPGHESFTAMRARGAGITDIAILVVAADDGVMPQTLEALDHANEADVPVIVVVNKIDKPDADPHRVRQQLSERGLLPEEWGGEHVFTDVSAKEGDNIDHLLEMILLISEMHELKANTNAPASGVVVEAGLDKARGAVSTFLVQRGTARIGDVVVAGTEWGKIRAMFDDRAQPVKSAGPATPVEVLGLSNPPIAGDEFRVVDSEKMARQMADRQRAEKKRQEPGVNREVSLENFLDRIREGEISRLKLVMKTDTQGSLEAILDSLERLSTDDVKLDVIHSGVGGISETDIMLASASEAIVMGFHVRPEPKASRAAELENVEIRTYQVIYDLTDDVQDALIGMLEPVYEEEELARAEVKTTFRVPGMGVIAGSYIVEGEISRNNRVRVVRDDTVVYDSKVSSLRRFKDDVKSVAMGYECGIGIQDFQDLKEGDILEVYEMREVPR